jgi:3',5'-cyclic AMP phosphodiesterase CpdA
MTQIAHLSDLHLLEPGHAERQGVARRRLAYLTFGRPNDDVRRRRRAVEVLSAARRSGADHVVITGDLTEDGLDVQFDILAEVLAESRLPPSQVTLVSGNHDAYVDGSAFERALRGPLAAYAPTSTPGVPVVLRDATILPVCTAFEQPYTRSAGAIDDEALDAAANLAEQSRAHGRALVLAMHHPPHRRFPVMQWIDGLVQHAAVGALLERHDHVHVLHGHTHATADRAVRPGATPRIFSTESVIDSRAPLRFYHARHARLWPAAIAPDAVPTLALA